MRNVGQFELLGLKMACFAAKLTDTLSLTSGHCHQPPPSPQRPGQAGAVFAGPAGGSGMQKVPLGLSRALGKSSKEGDGHFPRDSRGPRGSEREGLAGGLEGRGHGGFTHL